MRYGLAISQRIKFGKTSSNSGGSGSRGTEAEETALSVGVAWEQMWWWVDKEWAEAETKAKQNMLIDSYDGGWVGLYPPVFGTKKRRRQHKKMWASFGVKFISGTG